MTKESQLQTLGMMTKLVMALVDHPEQVVFTTIHEGDKTTLRLQVAPRDIGKVIGKGGHIATSLRIILSAAAKEQKCRFALDIVGSQEAAEQTYADGWVEPERELPPETDTLDP